MRLTPQRLRHRIRADIELRLELMPGLMKTLEDCTSKLQRYWNMGGEEDGRIAKGRKATTDRASPMRIIPLEAMLRSQEGKAKFLLLIDESGKVAGCDVLVASGVPAFDVMGCQVIRDKAKFSPAREAKGAAVRSTVVTPPVKWSEN